jgi:hypothetical protein
MLAHFRRGFGADGPITKRGAFGAAGDNSDMFCHNTIPFLLRKMSVSNFKKWGKHFIFKDFIDVFKIPGRILASFFSDFRSNMRFCAEIKNP